MAQAWKIRLPDGRVLRPGEWSATPLWSTVEIDDGTITDLAAFSYGQGGDVPGSAGPRNAEIIDTNMEGPGAILAENEELLLYTLQITLSITTTDDSTSANFFSSNGDQGPGDPPDISLENVLRVQRDTLVILKIAGQSGKWQMNSPLGFFPAGMGVHRTMGAANAQNNSDAPVLLGVNGNPSAGTNRALATPHHVAPGEAFEVQFEFPSGQVTNLELGSDSDARVRARVYADGYRRRPVA